MTVYQKKNFAKSYLASGISASDTQLTVLSGEASKFPTSGNFMATIWNKNSYPDPSDDPDREIVQATYSGSGDTFNITRAQEGTQAKAHPANSCFALTITAGQIQNLDASEITSGNLNIARMPTGGNWALSSNLTIDTNVLQINPSTDRIGIGTSPVNDYKLYCYLYSTSSGSEWESAGRFLNEREPTANSSGRAYGVEGRATLKGSKDLSDLIGGDFRAQHRGLGTVAFQVCINGNLYCDTSSGTVYTTNGVMIHGYLEKYNSSTWNISNLYGIKLGFYIYGGSVTGTNLYGIFIPNVTYVGSFSNAYAIYSEGGKVVAVGAYTTIVGGTNRDLYVDNTGLIGYVSSALETKKNIRPLDSQSEKIYQLRPVLFDFKDERLGVNQAGLIAEEVAEVLPELVSYKPIYEWEEEEIENENGQKIKVKTKIKSVSEDKTKPETVSYTKLIPLILNEVIKLNDRVKALENLITSK